MRNSSRNIMLIAAFLITTIVSGFPSYAQGKQDDIGTLKTEVAELETSIASLGKPNSLLGLLMQSRVEVLKITLILLQNQTLAESGAGLIKIVVPKVKSNPKQAAKLLDEITKQMAVIEQAQRDAETSGGLIQAIALSRVETEKLILAQLKAAWMQATYGIALPSFKPPVASTTETATKKTDEATNSEVESVSPQFSWADTNYPNIDYSAAIFKQLNSENFEIVGWWGLSEYKAEVDDSPATFAINVNGYTSGYGNDPTLKVSCREGTTAIIFDTDDYLITDYNSNTISVTYRIDEKPAQTSGWSKITTSKGAGLFKQKGEDFLRKLYGSKKVFFRLSEKNGKTHSLTIDMSGVDVIIDATAAACGFSTFDLTKEDYKAIQTLLNAGGFPAGIPDGQWGNTSKKALKAFQAANKLPETGAPDRETLMAMGLQF